MWFPLWFPFQSNLLMSERKEMLPPDWLEGPYSDWLEGLVVDWLEGPILIG